MAKKNISPTPKGKQIPLPPPKKFIRFPTLESILDFPSPGKPKSPTDSRLPNDQKFTCPNCDEITTGFPCETCGYDEEGLFDDYED